ncbi:MAG: tetratricopeptide repeat protein [Armatimonadota bacterium]
MSVIEEAEEHFRKAEKLSLVQDDKKRALVEYKKALELCPGMAEAHWRIGQIYSSAKKPKLDLALEEFKEAIRLSPDWSEGYICAAHVLCKMGQFEEALQYYHDALRIDSNDSRIHFSLGYCLSDLGRYSEAVESYRKGLNLKQDYGDISARMMLADALKEIGELDEAIREWKIVAETEAVWDYEEHHQKKAKQILRELEA